MDSEMIRQGGARGPVGSLPFIVALVLANVLASPTFDTFRPDSAPLDWIPVATEEQLPGRLWQDPLELAYEAWTEVADDAVTREALQSAMFGPEPTAQNVLGTARPTRVLAVMVRGGSFAEDREKRIRSRYAVVAGLGSEGYYPHDDQHIGYTVVDLRPSVKAPAVAPEEADDSGLDSTVAEPAHDPGELIVLPFEWYQNESENILVLWVDELALGLSPLHRLDALCGRVRGGLRWLDKIQILGPTSTTGLKRLHADDERIRFLTTHPYFEPGPYVPTALKGVEMYSSWATVDDEELCRSDPLPHSKDAPWFCGLRVIQTIGQDAALADLLSTELGLRIPTLSEESPGVGSQVLSGVLRATQMLKVKEKVRVLLVTEADTDYGRSWSNLFGRQGIEHDLLRYLRGIDGKVPGKKAFADKPPKGEDGEAEATAPTGVGQFDYLARLDRSLQGEPYDAIGVLGSDVYDKLAILKVVKRRFPEAVLFTTDLDARLFPTKASPETMNVVVASHYGLTLEKTTGSAKEDPNLAPFRSGYQTALWHSTRLAIQRSGDEPVTETAYDGAEFPEPVVYEIGRRGSYRLRQALPVESEEEDATPSDFDSLTSTVLPGDESDKGATVGDGLSSEGRSHHAFGARVDATATEWAAGLSFLLSFLAGILSLFRNVREDFFRTAFGKHIQRRLDTTVSASRMIEQRIDQRLTTVEAKAQAEPAQGSGWGRSLVSATALLGFVLALGFVLHPGAESLAGGDDSPAAVSSAASQDPGGDVFATGPAEKPDVGSSAELLGLLSVVLILGYCLLLFRPVRKSVAGFFVLRGQPSTVRASLALLVLVAAVGSCFLLAKTVSEPPPGGERFELFAGISIWPTEILRFIAVLYCAFALVKVWRDTARMNETIQHRYFFEDELPKSNELRGRLGKYGFFARDTFLESGRTIRECWHDYLAEGQMAPRALRVVCASLVFYLLAGFMFGMLGAPGVPYRGWNSLLADRLMLFLSVTGMILLIFAVLDVTLTAARFLQRVRAGEDRVWKDVAPRHAAETGLRSDDVSEVVGVRLVERMSETIGNFLYFPAIMLFMMMVSRSSLFDQWTWSSALILIFVFQFALLFGATRYIAYIARAMRDEAMERLSVDRLKFQRNKARVDELDNSMGVIERIRGGAFAGFKDHPLTKVLLLPFAGLGAASLMEFIFPLWIDF